ncbi:MAG: succinylglutamate desuccinylase/aspartoacylase family protein, partial [Devosia sp.]
DESLMPFTIYPRDSEPSRALAIAFGLPIAIASEGKSHSISGASDLGIPSLLPEMGGNGLWSDDTVAELINGVERVMKHIGMINRAVKPAPQATPAFVTMWVPTALATGLWYCLAEVGASVAAAQILGHIKDPFGKILATVAAEQPGTMVYRMTSLSVNEGEALLGIGTPLKADP